MRIQTCIKHIAKEHNDKVRKIIYSHWSLKHCLITSHPINFESKRLDVIKRQNKLQMNSNQFLFNKNTFLCYQKMS